MFSLWQRAPCYGKLLMLIRILSVLSMNPLWREALWREFSCDYAHRTFTHVDFHIHIHFGSPSPFSTLLLIGPCLSPGHFADAPLCFWDWSPVCCCMRVWCEVWDVVIIQSESLTECIPVKSPVHPLSTQLLSAWWCQLQSSHTLHEGSGVGSLEQSVYHAGESRLSYPICYGYSCSMQL